MDNVTNVDMLGLVKFTSNPFTPTAADRVLAAVNNTLVYWTGTSWSVVSGGGGSGATWESLYAADNTFNVIDGSGFTIADASAGANAAITITKDAGSSGVGIQITQAGSGADISGTSASWGVTKAGVGSFAGVSITGTSSALATTGAAVWGILDNSATSLRIGPSGGPVFLTFDTSNGAEVLSTDALTFQVTNGLTELIKASNTVSALRVTNNTATTFGANANSSGVAVIRSTSLTSGTLLQLQLTEGTLSGGFYLTCRDVTGSANVLTIGEDGRTVIAGAAGNDVFTVTAGDTVISDGSITLTDADNAASFTVTNDTATTASVFVVAGSGTFTGSTTSSFFTLTPSGLTSGTAFYLPLAAMADGKGINVVANAVTTGQAVLISSSAGTTQLTGAGRLLQVTHSGTATNSGILSEFISAATDETTILKVTASAANALGVALAVSTATTTGSGIAVTANALTTGAGISVTSSAATTQLTGAGRLFLVNHTGNATGSGVVAEIASAAADETTIFKVTASAALATGKAVHISTAAMTGGTALYIDATEATLTSGTYITCYDGAANDFSVGKYGATTIAGNASGTAALTLTAGDVTLTSGNINFTANASKIIATGTGANGLVIKNLKNAAASSLSGTQLDIEIDIGGNPYYFTVYPTKA